MLHNHALKKGIAGGGTYTGPRITIRRANLLYETARHTYLFGLTNGKQVIDGDGVAAFVNHLAAPTARSTKSGGGCGFWSLRNIKAGEELAYDYNLYDGDPGDKALCFCGPTNAAAPCTPRKKSNADPS